MSFGFSVGDFLAVIGLITQLRKDFADAPSQLRDLSAELKTFSILLQDAEVDLAADEVDPRQHEAFESTLSSARDFLKDLEKFIDDNKEIPKSAGSKAKVNIKRIWKRANFDQKEVSKFRHQISLIISGLQMLTSNEVKHHARKIARYVDKQEHRDILKWLSDEDFSYHKNYQSHLVRNREAGTRKWLLGSDEWKSWLKCGGQTLYCPGIPGSGKTFTTAMVIENIGNLSEDHGWVFAYVFCNYQQHKENMCEMLLRSLLRMVLEQTQEISDDIQRWPTRNTEISIDEIMEQLRIAIRGCSRVFFMIDALDELDLCDEFVSYLFDLEMAVGVNLYFTSRKIPHIQVLFDKAMIIPIKATEHDVGVYLEHQMKKPHVPNFVRSNQALQDEIKKTVVNAVGEMFLLAELQIIQLMQSKSTRRLQNSLKAITLGTSTYETAYQAAMDRINSQDQRLCELAKNAISILAYTERPLLAQELVHALSVDLNSSESSDTELYETGDLQSMIDSLGEYDHDLMPTIEDVLAASTGLIVHQPDSGIVRLVHKTTKEYLMSDNGKKKWFPRAQLTIAAICLIYSQAFEVSDGKTEWPFLDYAQKHYGHHIMAHLSFERSKGPTSAQPPNEASASDSSPFGPQAQQLIDQIGLARMAQELGGTEDVLIAACEKNQLNFARVLLSTKQYEPSSGQTKISTPSVPYAPADCAMDRALQVSVRNGHSELVELLLKYGANPLIQSKHALYGTALSLLAVAAQKGHHSIVCHLLDHGNFTMAMMQHNLDGFRGDAKFPRNPHDFEVYSPICHAAISGSIPCVKTLLKSVGIEHNINSRDEEHERILENVTLCAMAGSHDHVLEILPQLSSTNMESMLRDLGDPNLLFTSIRWDQSVAHRASQDKEGITNFFLRTYTFDFSIHDATGVNALILAAKQNLAKALHLILKEREDLLNSQDSSGRTALSWAVRSGAMDSISVLLGYKGIQADLVDAWGRAPIYYLQRYSFQGDDVFYTTALLSMIPVLEQGINIIVERGCTLLHVLIDNSYLYDRRMDRWLMLCQHWQNLERCRRRDVFESRQEWEHDFESYSPRLDASGFRQALGATSVSAAEIRASPCRCRMGTIFLAVSTENVEYVEVLLDFFPDLVNDRFFDGSSPLDLARCIRNQQRRQSMIDLILSKHPIMQTYNTDVPGSGIDQSVSGEAQVVCNFTDGELHQRHEDCARDETTDE